MSLYSLPDPNNQNEIWCWEKDIRTTRGKMNHLLLYLHKESYLVVLRRKQNRFELVTAYIKSSHEKMIKEKSNYEDPRNNSKKNTY